jgi:O-acetyl-ADP-ribose deacetylase
MPDFAIRILLAGGKGVEFCGPADITKETTDGIVNAANSSLLGGGGVDGAIHRSGGHAILDECRKIAAKIGSLPPGKAVITTGGSLAAKHVVHTVGPVYRDGRHGEAEKLAGCYRESILLADQHRLKSLSFPAISTGAFGYPISEAAPVAILSTLDALRTTEHVAAIRFVFFDVATLREYVRAAEHTIQSVPDFKIERGLS